MNNLLIISNNPLVTTQLRFAISLVKRSTEVGEFARAELSSESSSMTLDSANLIFVVLEGETENSLATLAQVRAEYCGRIVAVGVADSAQELLAFLRSGADDFIDSTADIVFQTRELYSRFSNELPTEQREKTSPVVSVIGAFGGAGATIVSANIAVLLATRFQQCGLLDLSGGLGDLASHLSLDPRYSVSDLCSNFERLDREMLLNAVTEHSSGIGLVASGQEKDPGVFPPHAATEKIIEVAAEAMPCVLTDLDRRAPYAVSVLQRSDAVILLTGLTFAGAQTTRHLLEHWGTQGLDTESLLLVANHCRRRAELSMSEAESIIGRSVACVLADDPFSANSSVNCGNPSVLEFPQSSLSKELREVFAGTMKNLDGSGCANTRVRGRPIGSLIESLTEMAVGMFG